MISCSICPWMTIAVRTHRPWPLARPKCIGIILLCIGYYSGIDQVELALTWEPRSILVETILFCTNDTMDSDRVLTDMIVLTLKGNTLCCTEYFMQCSATACMFTRSFINTS